MRRSDQLGKVVDVTGNDGHSREDQTKVEDEEAKGEAEEPTPGQSSASSGRGRGGKGRGRGKGKSKTQTANAPEVVDVDDKADESAKATRKRGKGKAEKENASKVQKTEKGKSSDAAQGGEAVDGQGKGEGEKAPKTTRGRAKQAEKKDSPDQKDSATGGSDQPIEVTTFAGRYCPQSELGAAKWQAIREVFNTKIKPRIKSHSKLQARGDMG